MFQISKHFTFSASHQLTGLPDDHQCSRLHGHNYIVEVVLESPTLNSIGFVQDYGALAPIKTYIDDKLDHRHLNDLFDVTTAEALAEHFYKRFKHQFPLLVAVRVSETPKTWAEYRP